MEKDTGLQPEMPSSTEKVRKMCEESTREASKYPKKTIEKARKLQGAGAFGARHHVVMHYVVTYCFFAFGLGMFH